jgi:hypothetical protein
VAIGAAVGGVLLILAAIAAFFLLQRKPPTPQVHVEDEELVEAEDVDTWEFRNPLVNDGEFDASDLASDPGPKHGE